MSDALIPQVKYWVHGNSVKLRLRLIRDNKPAWETEITAPSTNPADIVPIVLKTIVSAAQDQR